MKGYRIDEIARELTAPEREDLVLKLLESGYRPSQIITVRGWSIRKNCSVYAVRVQVKEV